MNRDQESEMSLLVRMLAREERAWRDFAVRYDRLIYRCITKVTGRFSSFLSRDDIREIYASLLYQLLSDDMRKLRSFDFDRGNKFGSWIGLLAINAAYDYLRKMRHEPNRAPLAEADMVPVEGPSAFDAIASHEQASRLREATRALSAKDREFVELYYTEGVEPEQIAERMHISVKTVYSKKHKIQAHLERLLGAAA